LRLYLDASVLVSLFVEDAGSDRAMAYLGVHQPNIVISDFAAAEFASAVARLVRTGDLDPDQARSVFSTFDVWSARVAERVTTISTDVAVTESFLRRMDLNLRTPDGLNLAICQRAGATMLSFDLKLSEAARALAVPLASA
jgi:predicted nucleic acid-binding protein